MNITRDSFAYHDMPDGSCQMWPHVPCAAKCIEIRPDGSGWLAIVWWPDSTGLHRQSTERCASKKAAEAWAITQVRFGLKPIDSSEQPRQRPVSAVLATTRAHRQTVEQLDLFSQKQGGS